MNLFAELLVLAAGTYLVGLGVVAFVRPHTAKRFLAGFATSACAHYAELAVRMAIGLALVQAAPRMWMSEVFTVVGWIIVGTTVALLVVPWRVHHRFASWSVPMATAKKNMPFIAVGALMGGAFMLLSLWRRT